MNNTVDILEVGLRDGLQNINRKISIQDRLFIIEGLIEAGITKIQVASFVDPKLVPQMAYAENLVKRLNKMNEVEYSGLVFNARGIERALSCGLEKIETSISTSEIYSKRNLGMSVSQSLINLKTIVELAKESSMEIRAGLQCVWGYDGYNDYNQKEV